jgi:hypothetical protein
MHDNLSSSCDRISSFITGHCHKRTLLVFCSLRHTCTRNLKDIGAVDLNLLNRLVATTNTDASKLVNDILALHDLAEDSVLAVKVRGGTKSDTKRYCQRRKEIVSTSHGSLTRTGSRWCQDQSWPC